MSNNELLEPPVAATDDSNQPPAPIQALHTSQPDERTASAAGALALGAIAAAALAACGGGSGGGTATGSSTGNTAPPPVTMPPPVALDTDLKAESDADAARFLQQAQFSASPEEIAAVRGSSYAAYLRQQFGLPIAQTGWEWLATRGYSSNDTGKDYIYNSTIAEYTVWQQLFSAQDAVRKRVALALSEIMVVSFGSMEIDWRGHAVTAYWDILNKHAFGNFRDLLKDVTLSAAMGHYLNTKGNKKEDAKTGRQPDENYAREVMQLFTIGLNELNPDGTEKIEGGKPVETYTADDVSQLARVFTGYNYDYSAANKVRLPGLSYDTLARDYARQPMKFTAADHSMLAVNALKGRINIPANTDGLQALDMALTGLFEHPNVGPFIGKQLIQRLVTSNPSPAYVSRVTAAFNGNGVRGDMKAVLSAILLDPEARSRDRLSDPGWGKIREPMLRLVQWGRTFKVRSEAGSWKIGNLSDVSYSLGQSPFHSPSVFNFFRPGYVPPGTDLATNNAPAPEMQIVNETTVGAYINFLTYFMESGLNTNNPTSNSTNYVGGQDQRDIKPDYSVELSFISHTTASPTDAEATAAARKFADRLNLLMCAGQMSSATYNEIFTALKGAILVDHWNEETKKNQKLNANTPIKYRLKWVAAGIFLTMISADYLAQK